MNLKLYVSPKSATLFKSKSDKMLDEVNEMMYIKNQNYRLIGSNPRVIMETNHQNHVIFMGTLFTTNDYTMLEKTLPWILHTYLSKGFSISYFSHVLKTWMEVIKNNLLVEACEEIIPVYEYMLNAIENDEVVKKVEISSENERVLALTEMLIKGSYMEASRYIRSFVKDKDSLFDVYLNIIQPAMYTVGNMWEKNEISVSHEHLATSIVMRILSSFYERYVLGKSYKYKVVIAASVNEYHEIGARMVSDFLESNGYDVKYLGTNVPLDDLVKILIEDKPKVLGLSISMSYNIGLVIETISKIRETPELKNLKILAGGYAFSYADKTTLGDFDIIVPADLYETLAQCDSWIEGE